MDPEIGKKNRIYMDHDCAIKNQIKMVKQAAVAVCVWACKIDGNRLYMDTEMHKSNQLYVVFGEIQNRVYMDTNVIQNRIYMVTHFPDSAQGERIMEAQNGHVNGLLPLVRLLMYDGWPAAADILYMGMGLPPVREECPGGAEYIRKYLYQISIYSRI